MRIDMSKQAVTNSLKTVDELRKACLSLANSSAGNKLERDFLPTRRLSEPRTRSATDFISKVFLQPGVARNVEGRGRVRGDRRNLRGGAVGVNGGLFVKRLQPS
jgi:hypothetical protein